MVGSDTQSSASQTLRIHSPHRAEQLLLDARWEVTVRLPPTSSPDTGRTRSAYWPPNRSLPCFNFSATPLE